MAWTKQQIADCQTVADLVTSIIHEAFYLIKKYEKVTEFEVQKYIRMRYKEKSLVTDRRQIVAFANNTGQVHYYPDKKCNVLKPNTLILIDCWARLNKPSAPFCDTTWMAYYGKQVPKKIQDVFNIMINARDSTVNMIKRNLKNGKMPIGNKLDGVARKLISDAGYGDKFMHTLGHSLGFDSPHGRADGLNKKNRKRLTYNLGYTIEPGIYFKDKFGVRSEIDFYISRKNELVFFTPVQEEIVILNI